MQKSSNFTFCIEDSLYMQMAKRKWNIIAGKEYIIPCSVHEQEQQIKLDSVLYLIVPQAWWRRKNINTCFEKDGKWIVAW